MKTTILIIVIILTVLMLNCRSNTYITSGYIKIEYVGETNKPIPTVVFYIDNSFDTTTLQYGKAFRISETEFNLIENVIEDSKLLLKTNKQENSYFAYSIITNKKSFTFISTNKQSTQQLFDSIIYQFQDDFRKELVKDYLNNIIRRVFG